tara:strand:+ start:43125 stop:43550 length:426 start_codon:yes stop_codon:yes gene_type:complete
MTTKKDYWGTFFALFCPVTLGLVIIKYSIQAGKIAEEEFKSSIVEVVRENHEPQHRLSNSPLEGQILYDQIPKFLEVMGKYADQNEDGIISPQERSNFVYDVYARSPITIILENPPTYENGNPVALKDTLRYLDDYVRDQN